MAGRLAFLALAAPLLADGATLKQGVQFRAPNPIRKVVNMLQAMQQKVTEEGKKEEALFHKFMCYCQTGVGNLAESIDQARTQIEQRGTAGEQAVEKKVQVEADLKAHKASRDEAKETIAKATALREKEAKAFAADAAQSQSNLAAIGKAVAAIERGNAGSFMQTQAGSVVKQYAIEQADLADSSRQTLLSFLSGTVSDEYEPSSGEALGILKQMRDRMQKDQAEAAEAEKASIASFQELMAAKKKEVESLQEQIEAEQMRIGELSVLAATTGHDLEAMKATLAENERFLAELKTNCGTKTGEWEKIKTARGEELVALAETIKVLNDDENTDLFKKALPSGTSFMQIQVTASAVKARALKAITATAAHTKIPHPQLEFIALALRGKKTGFEKIVTMIDDLIKNLKKEQKDDDDKKFYCDKQFKLSDDKHKELELAVSNSEAAIDDIEGNIDKLKEEIQELQHGIKELDASVKEATTQRQAEHADYREAMSGSAAAKDVLAWAKNRLNKFYNPSQYRPELVQVSEDSEDGLGEDPPEFPKAHEKSSESAGVIQMLDHLIADLDKDMQTGEINEKHAQKNYEKLLEQARTKRAQDSQALTEKEAAVAALEEGLQAENDKKSGAEKELAATQDYIRNLHNECDWLLQYYGQRKEAREGEIDGLEKGKAVLSGADYSLVQTGHGHVRRSTGFLPPRRHA